MVLFDNPKFSPYYFQRRPIFSNQCGGFDNLKKLFVFVDFKGEDNSLDDNDS
jgi:hypothetical protein